ncbi:exodeoxyribonuclease V subunit beta [Francisella philomiragia]|uniref:exodeoxyribonuclease V subunit beta n=1 Tax=Francisella philomiragia TaxID=28110 RepID=UPI000B5944DE|nr:exodeoxyribonuclease V subunit beta [Francisella philomiragia]MBK2094649.1 exodeoxyribonuclease V subunit beta [Francisella philomiragia]
MTNLDAKTITLQGRHIIEASAGTGKTFNITELYLRLLVEKRLLPSQILVMTFTKDATQEIIGRVEAKIRDVLENISEGKEVKVSIKGQETLIQKSDENYKHLKRSLLEIDEAAIFTIHGFCKKVLSEQAFASGMDMDVSMEVDTSDILQKVVEDFFRKHINKNKTNFEYLQAYKLHTPDIFLDKLRNVVRSSYEILADTFERETEELAKEKQQVFVNLEANTSFIFESLIIKHKDKNKRIEEWQIIENWANDSQLSLMPKEVSAFINGNRYRGRDDIAEVFEEIKALKDKYSKIKDIDEYKKQFDAAQFIKQACLKIRQDFIKAKEQKGVLDFDDLITKLCQSVKKSPDLVKTLQHQYQVALIDEFQDTDAEQYEILDTIYPQSNKLPRQSVTDTPSSQRGIDDLLLLMIGDPKQAIYGFRGGDIFTYLKAKDSCSSDNQWSMDTNWRSTSEMIKAYNRLFYKQDYLSEEEGQIGANIFSDGIGYQLVKASPKANEKAKDFDDNLKPINYFYYQVAEDDNKSDIDSNLSAWTANEIVRLLNSKKVVESDIAILVENGKQAKVIQKALQAKKLSSVYLSQRDNVYHSQEATEILALMEGINDLENKSMLKRALSTSLLGGRADKFISYIDENDVLAWDEEIEKAKSLRQQWHKYGFMAFIMQIIHQNFTQRSDSKERVITNILHLTELIKVAENKYKHPNQLIKWYRQQLNSTATSEGELRLESDDNLIKIITIHGSKGLEYSVVFIPFASYVSKKKFEASDFSKYYDKDLRQTVYKIGKDDSIKPQIENEVIEELMRLFYVAVTRAEHRCYIGVAKYNNSEKSPLARFLAYQKDDDWLEKIQNITANPTNQSSLIDVATSHCYESENLIINDEKNSDISQNLKANNINKLANDNWEMLSFSKISKSKSQNIALEKENDESEDDSAQKSQQELEFRFTAPKGADIGNILHNVLEHTDFSLGKIDNNLLQEQMDRYKVVAAEDFDNLKVWLEECLVAPIPFSVNMKAGVIPSGLTTESTDDSKSFCLKDIPNTKTLKEAEFYFPISNEKLYKKNIIEILAEYRNQNIDYDEFASQKIFGMLHGFIDLIFEYDGKFYVADYKSNYLGDKLEDYNQAAMSEKNQSSFYDLQYLIYSVALNKYLRQNIENYNYEKHFGGVYYFYLRGMKDGYGVYRARPTLEIINKIANLFNGDNYHV